MASSMSGFLETVGLAILAAGTTYAALGLGWEMGCLTGCTLRTPSNTAWQDCEARSLITSFTQCCVCQWVFVLSGRLYASSVAIGCPVPCAWPYFDTIFDAEGFQKVASSCSSIHIINLHFNSVNLLLSQPLSHSVLLPLESFAVNDTQLHCHPGMLVNKRLQTQTSSKMCHW